VLRCLSTWLQRIAFQACSFNRPHLARTPTWHNARHRRAQEFRTIFTSVPKRFQLHVRNRQCLPSKYFAWDDAKKPKLRKERGIGFEDVVFHIERGDLFDILEHPNPDRYAGQRIFVVRRGDYVYPVTFVEDEHPVFLKTIIPKAEGHEAVLRGGARR
jgi:hypothetical protein